MDRNRDWIIISNHKCQLSYVCYWWTIKNNRKTCILSIKTISLRFVCSLSLLTNLTLIGAHITVSEQTSTYHRSEIIGCLMFRQVNVAVTWLLLTVQKTERGKKIISVFIVQTGLTWKRFHCWSFVKKRNIHLKIVEQLISDSSLNNAICVNQIIICWNLLKVKKPVRKGNFNWCQYCEIFERRR